MIVDMRISYLLHHDGRRGIETKINAPFLRHGEKGGRESQKKTPTPRVAILIDVSIATAAIWHGVDILFYDDPSVFSARPYPQHRSGEIDYPWNSGYADQRGGGGGWVWERRTFARQSNNLPPTIREKRERNISISAIIDLLLHHIQRRIDCSQLALS